MASHPDAADFTNEVFRPSKLFDLTGRVALVTGGGTGIGLAQAQGLAGAGAKVYILSRREEVIQDVVKKYGFAGSISADVTSKDSIEAAVKEFSQKEDRLDILVSNAGGAGPMHFGADTSSPDGETDPAKKHQPVDPEEYKKRIWEANSFENWDELFRLNSHSLLFVAIAFLPLLAKGSAYGQQEQHGRKKWTATVIATTSISAWVKQSQMHYAYNASKASAAHLTELIAYEFTFSQKSPIRVNSVAPGVVPSQMTANNHDPKTHKSDLDQKLPKMSIPAGRYAYDEDMANAIIFLASNEYMHGQNLACDGGFTLSEP